MGRQRKRRQKGNSVQSPPQRPGRLLPAMIVPAVAVIIAAGLWWGRAKPPGVAPPPAPPVKTASAALPAAAAVSQSDLERLKGKWRRTDGGYVVEIRSVDDRGNLDASYLNPRPIHVARAEASQEGGVTKVSIELRDVNYPGSTYNLRYDPEQDQLRGIYHHAGLQRIFEVVFVRSAASP